MLGRNHRSEIWQLKSKYLQKLEFSLTEFLNCVPVWFENRSNNQSKTGRMTVKKMILISTYFALLTFARVQSNVHVNVSWQVSNQLMPKSLRGPVTGFWDDIAYVIGGYDETSATINFCGQIMVNGAAIWKATQVLAKFLHYIVLKCVIPKYLIYCTLWDQITILAKCWFMI